ncbi:NfeD family protein [Vulcanibacillus modesticaldus]|uniref:NfeD family protein n=1 Tax=Vulcanibacillus modesticaldus TaxID=337097 RepID=UPI000B2A6955|nr:nodulation protein NfeD [Vulcanibacillus modesticaldus]
MTRKVALTSMVAILFVIQLFSFLYPVIVSAKEQVIYVVKVEQTIDKGLARYLDRAFDEANEGDADAIILEINTLGGSVDAAVDIGELIIREQIPIIAFIKGNAISAGSYISFSADKIFMEPNSNIGAAAVRTISGEEVDPKITSFWASKMENAAKQQGKNDEIARGMVDPNVEIPGISKKGELITLGSDEALQYGIADGIANNRNELLKLLGLENARVEEVSLSPAEMLARLVTNPFVIPFLLTIGLAGILIELFIPGFGIPGIVGLSAFGLYFFGNYLAGFAGLESIFLFVIGFILMVIELFVPGFGIFGVIGVILLGSGIVLAAENSSYGFIGLTIALFVNTILAFILFKYFSYRGIWNHFILKEEQNKAMGYVSHDKDVNLIGKKGKTVSKLRPAGIAIIEGIRYDVVSEGNFINMGQDIEVIRVDGTKIVVREFEIKN